MNFPTERELLFRARVEHRHAMLKQAEIMARLTIVLSAALESPHALPASALIEYSAEFFERNYKTGLRSSMDDQRHGFDLPNPPPPIEF